MTRVGRLNIQPFMAGRPLYLADRGTTYVREINGPPGAPTVVLIHGLGATAGLSWAGMATALAQTFRVVAIDQRGHGRGIRTRNFRLEDCADDVAALVSHLDLGRVILVGYSMGGPIATLVWRRHPAMVDGLVLVATSGNFRIQQIEKVGYAALSVLVSAMPGFPGAVALQAGVGRTLRRVPVAGRRLRSVMWKAEERSYSDPRAVLQAAHALGQFSADGWSEQIDVPTAVVATTRDRVVAATRQVGLALTIPTAVLHPVSDGHLGVLAAQNGSSNQAVMEACEQVARRVRTAALTANGAAR